jgi:hypothetical protein
MATEAVENFDEPTEQFVEAVAPVVNAELPDIKLFGRWSCDEVQVSDMSLQVITLAHTRTVHCSTQNNPNILFSFVGLHCREREVRSLFASFGRPLRS